MWVLLRKTPGDCVEMFSSSSGKVSYFCLFSYTFRLCSSLFNIFMGSRSPRQFPASTIRFPCALRLPRRAEHSSCPPGDSAERFRSPATYSPRRLVNGNLAAFPTGRKEFCRRIAPFPTGRKAGFRFSIHGSPSQRGRHRVTNVQIPAQGEAADRHPLVTTYLDASHGVAPLAV